MNLLPLKMNTIAKKRQKGRIISKKLLRKKGLKLKKRNKDRKNSVGLWKKSVLYRKNKMNSKDRKTSLKNPKRKCVDLRNQKSNLKEREKKFRNNSRERVKEKVKTRKKKERRMSMKRWKLMMMTINRQKK